MKLPHANLAVVEREKITEYLLNPAHPDNGGKARFFAGLGFSVQDWGGLAGSLRELALRASVARSVQSTYGCKYVVEGQISTPCGKMPRITTVWIINQGSRSPRRVTAYPCDQPEVP